jgi:ATP-dependent HslUV protease ATP-binding subunit HslU
VVDLFNWPKNVEFIQLRRGDRAPSFEITTNAGIEEMGINIKDMLPNLFGQKPGKRKMRVAEALDYLVQEEEQKLIDMEQVTRVAGARGAARSHGLPRG